MWTSKRWPFRSDLNVLNTFITRRIWYILSIPLEAGRGISTETWRLDDVFPPDDLGSGSFTPFIIYVPYIIAAMWAIKECSF